MPLVNKISKLIGPACNSAVKGPSVSISHKLFTKFGLVHFNHGIGTLMPLLLKSLKKLEVLSHKEMKELSAFEFLLPVLTHSDLFKTSERINLPDLFKVFINENKCYILNPTCEEAVTHILKSYKSLSYKDLPIRLYQISSKFRNEKRPRSGLLRANEFLMKDLYCFDADEDSCEQCYQEVLNQYHNFFDLLNVPYVCAEGLTGNIGGLKSHEFHFLTEAGQDKVILCKNCGYNENLEVSRDNLGGKCKKCQSSNISIENGIEVGHAFKLGTRFTMPFKATYKNKKGINEILQMSSFGLGLTRILAATVEVLSTSEEIRWPTAIAPYLVCVLPPKAGSKEEETAKDLEQIIYCSLNQLFEDNVILDDRTSQTLGRRIMYNKQIGFPFQVVLGKSICNNPPTVEIIDSSTGSIDNVQIPDVNQFILNKLESQKKFWNNRKASCVT